MKTSKMVESAMVYAEYNRYGYNVYETRDGKNIFRVHTCGNHPTESSLTVSLNDPSKLSLAQIRSMAIQTTREHAETRKWQYKGVERISDNEE